MIEKRLLKSPHFRRKVLLSLKVLIFVLLFAAIYQQVFSNKDLESVSSRLLVVMQPENLLFSVLVLLLMPFNWGAEALKWFILIRPVEKLSYRRALAGVFAGVTLSLFTPNRIGEYGGRFMFLQRPWSIRALLVTLAGSLAQIIVTLLAGVAGLYYIMDRLPEKMPDMLFIAGALLIAIFLAFFLFFVNKGSIDRALSNWKYYKKARQYVSVFRRFSWSEWANVLSVATLRYIIYVFQYVLLLHIFDVELGWKITFAVVTGVFLVQTIIPSIAALELGIRGNVALFMFSSMSDNSIGILAASFSLWVVNLIVPSIIGYGCILGARALKR